MATAKRDSWSNNFGFIMATAGAAVGLGNIWRFPYVCGENGGGAFLIAYVACVILIGMPILWAEIAIGRSSGQGSGGAFDTLVKKKKKLWKLVGLLGVLIGFLVTSYYTIIAGWTLEYLWQSFQGGLSNITGTETQAVFDTFMADNSRQVFWHVIFTLITVTILLGGVSGGIEKVAEILMPILLFILVGLAIFSVSLELDMAAEAGKVAKGLQFLFTPDWSKFTGQSFYMALGQAAFSLSIAAGTMVAYGSYLNKKENIPALGSIVVLMDTSVAILGAIMIFPIVFAFGLNPEAGTGLVFVTLPALFAQIPAGYVIAPVFYILLFFAALTSSISLLEPAITHLIDEFKSSRVRACIITGAVSIVLGILWIFTNTLEYDSIFTNIDKLISDLLIPLEALLIAAFVGWAWDKRSSVRQFRNVPRWMYRAWHYACKWLCPIAIGVILIRGLEF